MLVTFKYLAKDTPIHRLDPRAKFIFLLCFLLSVTQFWDLRVLLAFFGLAMGYYALARLPFRETRRAWFFMVFFAVVLVGINTLFVRGGRRFETEHILFRLPLLSLPITAEGVVFSAGMIARMLSIATVALPIPFTVNPQLYGVAFRKLGLPDQFAFAMDLAFRFVPTLARDFFLTLDAQKARGYEVERLRGGPIAQIRKLAPLIVPVTINAIVGGEDVVNALDLRCFGAAKRTWLQELRYTRWDKAVIAFSLAMLGASTLANLLGYGGFWLPGWVAGLAK
ncbi:MAG TPA: energy-coupling factor transporter transmembrane protein EcfT [Chloroflexi bacterium]|nr:energy-coupling factor transporter transmembrane protein EcfT [Chloroflexota bacterium]